MTDTKRPYTPPQLRPLTVGDPRVWTVLDDLLRQKCPVLDRGRKEFALVMANREKLNAQFDADMAHKKLVNDIINAATKLATCEHPLANLLNRSTSTCGACGSVYLKDVGWAKPLYVHMLSKLIETLQLQQAITEKRSG